MRCTVFEQDTPLELVKALHPDVLVKGGDYSLDTVVGRTEVESWGTRARHSAHRRPFHHPHHRGTSWLLTFLRDIDRARDALRPLKIERNASPYAEGSCADRLRQDARAVHRERRGGRARLEAGQGRRLDDGGVRDASARDAHPHFARAIADRRAHAGDPATHRSQSFARCSTTSSSASSRSRWTATCCRPMAARAPRRSPGACVAVVDAFDWLVRERKIAATPVKRRVAAVSVGVIDGERATGSRL